MNAEVRDWVRSRPPVLWVMIIPALVLGLALSIRAMNIEEPRWHSGPERVGPADE